MAHAFPGGWIIRRKNAATRASAWSSSAISRVAKSLRCFAETTRTGGLTASGDLGGFRGGNRLGGLAVTMRFRSVLPVLQRGA